MKMKIIFVVFALLSFVSFSQAPGDNCASAVSLTLPTVEGGSVTTGVQTTTGLVNDYAAGSYCTNASYGGGSDGVYVINVPTSGYEYKFEYLSSGMTYKILSIHTGCIPTTGNCVGGFVTSSGTSGSVTLTMSAGTYYLVVDNWPSPNSGNFNLRITLNNIPDVGEVCSTSQGFCSDVSYNFANTTIGTPPSGPDYSMGGTCVSSSKPLVWYYMEIKEVGPMVLTLAQSTLPNGAGSGIDVDFIMWGPYPNLDNACTSVMSGDSPLQGSFSIDATETIAIGAAGGDGSCASTPASPSIGDVYVVGISNYGNTSGYITFSQSSGSGSADCNTITPCDISSVTANPGTCSGGVFDITGSVTFTDAPATGSMTVTSSFGESSVYSAPFVSPLAYTISNESGTGSGTVDVVFSDDAFCTATSSSFTAPTCVVCTDASISSQSTATQTVCLGGSYSAITVTAAGTNPTYQWYSNTTSSNSGGVSLGSASGAQTASYTPSAASAGTSYYYCVVTGDCGSPVTSAVSGAMVTNPTSSTYITSQSTPTETVCLGNPLSVISVTVPGNNVTYQWYSNTTSSNVGGTLIPLATASTYTPDASVAGTMYYYCVVTGGCDLSTETSAVSGALIVNPTSSYITSQPTATETICFGSTFSPLIVTTTGTGLAYQWYSNTTSVNTGGTLLVGETGSTYIPDASSVGTMYYYCEVSSVCGVTEASSVSGAIVVNPSSNFISSQSTLTESICDGGSFTTISVTTIGTGLTYQWYSNNTSTNSGGALIVGETGSTYTPDASAVGTMYYYCEVSSVCGATEASAVSGAMIVTPITTPTVSISSDDIDNTICSGSNVTFTATPSNGGSAPIYQWKVNGSNIGAGGTTFSSSSLVDGDIVTVEMTANNSCQTSSTANSNSITITVNDPIVITSIQEVTQSICLGDAFNPISISATGGSLTYQWYSNTTSSTIGSTLIVGATTSSYTPLSSVVGDMYYYCLVSNTCSTNSQGPISAVMTVNETVTLDETVSQDQTICLGESLNQLSVNVTSGAVASYQWYSNTTNDNTSGIIITGEVLSTYIPDATLTGDIYYYCIVNGACGSVTSSTIKVTVNEIPSSPLLEASYTICNNPLPEYVSLGNSVPLNWYSDIALTTLVGVDSILTNTTSTTYYVSYIVNGCEGAAVAVDIEISDCLLDVPTAFTPDGDNVNDTWDLVDLDTYYPENVVTIFNRWGELLFTSPKGDYESFPWDGKVDGKSLPVGSYYYFIDYNNGTGKKANGVVTIILNN